LEKGGKWGQIPFFAGSKKVSDPFFGFAYFAADTM
jgi:hypothetical protein